jgi:phosphoserine phosphatase
MLLLSSINFLPQSMKKLALFDFCETLVSFQTAGRFVDFVRAKLGSRRMLKLEELRVKSKALRFTAVANKLLPHYNFDKRLHLYQLKGLSKKNSMILHGNTTRKWSRRT